MRYTVALVAILLLMGCGATTRTPNVILILIDTLRADHVHCYGYERDITPTLDSLAAEGIMWANVQGQSAWTLPAMTTIFTGLTERQHLAGFRGNRLYGISPDLETLPELFRNSGYQTSGFYNVPVMGQGYGFSQGMDHVDYEGCVLTVDADVINNKFLQWLEEFHDPEVPFFSVLHYFDPHYPYMPLPPWDGIYSSADHPHTHWASEPTELLLSANREGLIDSAVVQRMLDLYDGEIAFMDAEIGNLMAELRNRGLGENTVIIVVADHGEEFHEHGGLLHGFTLFTETTRIPLIFCGPGIEGGIVDSTTAAQIDIFPTVLNLCGIQHSGDLDGVDLFHGNSDGRALPASGFASDIENYVTVRRDGAIVFWEPESDISVQFDLAADPLEQDSLQAEPGLVEEASWYWATPPAANPGPVPNTQSRVEALRALGYCR